MKKLLATALAGAMVVSMAACGGNSAPAPAESSAPAETAAEVAEDAAPAEGQTYNVGICQLIEHPALDAATQGFKDAIVEAFGENVTFDEQNAQGDSATCATIINSFVSNQSDLILANATPALQAAAAGTSEIPILGTSVTDYATALEIDEWTGTVGNNISGTSDLAPLSEQAAMIKELFPDAKNVGLLYCSAEANSKYQVDMVAAELEAMGYTCNFYAFADSNDLSAVCTIANSESDIIYVPTDNTAANNTELIDSICAGQTPIIAGEEGICAGCGVATLSISYYDLGYTTGQMAVKILSGEANVAEMPVEFAPNVTKKVMTDRAAAFGIAVPDDYEAIVVE